MQTLDILALPAPARGAALFAVCALAAGTGSAAELRTSRAPIEGQYLVILQPKAASLMTEHDAIPRVAEVAERLTAAHGGRMLWSYRQVLRGFALQADDATLVRLLADPRVAWIEEDGRTAPTTLQNGATWGIDRVNQRQSPPDGRYTYDTGAANVHAYVIDSGIDLLHREYVSRIGPGVDLVNDGNGVGDCQGHGAHVSGTLGGLEFGIAKAITLHPVRVFGCSGGAPWSRVIAAMDWVAINRQLPAVVNMSLSGAGNTAADAAVAALVGGGVPVVTAAGNNSYDACLDSPARVPEAITVAATGANDRRADFSSFGSCVDLFAPGEGIVSASITDPGASIASDGTSMAAPHVAGAVALILARTPNATPAQLTTTLLADATVGAVSNAGSGSPNRLLFIPTAPAITRFDCPAGDVVPRRYVCELDYLSDAGPTSILWTGSSGTRTDTSVYSGNCGYGRLVNVAVTLSNAYGSTGTGATFYCPT